MTALLPETSQSTAGVKKNPFATALKLGFSLSDGDCQRAEDAMRQASVYRRMEVIVPPKLITPNTKDKSPAEKRAIRAEVDAFNSDRAEKMRVFLVRFLPPDIAALLAGKMKSHVEGLVVLTVPGDEYFTMIVEHS